MKILAIETSCDDTAAAVMEDIRVLSSVISSQTDLHAKWGGVVPDIAKRAHQERIKTVIAEALKRAFKTELKSVTKGLRSEEKVERTIEEGMKLVDVIAVTLGPGLAIALGIGVNTAKEMAIKFNKKLVAVNHIEGHILSNLVQNSKGKPKRLIEFPALALTASGGHTKIILVKEIGKYEVIGETLDDAAGEALDKAAKLMGLGYPGGPVLERLSEKGNIRFMELPRPMAGTKGFDYSFSGLKTSFYYRIKEWPANRVIQNVEDLAASFQWAVFDTLIMRYKKAIEELKPKSLLASGGVMANQTLRKMLKQTARSFGLPVYMPFRKDLNTDNAMMIGAAGYFMAVRGDFVKDVEKLDRDPRAKL